MSQAVQSSSRTGGATKNGGSMIVFAAPLAKRLGGNALRLPPTYCGVRRVRPSTRLVAQQASHNKASSNNRSTAVTVVYKIVDPESGQERRMTSREKKEAKYQQRRQAKQRKLEERVARNETTTDDGDSNEQQAAKNSDHGLPPGAAHEESVVKDSTDRYVNLPVNMEAMAQELADLRGERDGVPPVMLSPPMSRLLLLKSGSCSQEHHQQAAVVVCDDTLAQQWAVALKESMAAAEKTRQAETGIRPMPYQLVPQIWKRMRPSGMTTAAGIVAKSPSSNNNKDGDGTFPTESDDGGWALCQIRPPTPAFDSDVAAVVQVLHTGTHLHISCGAKFGCDYLLYDGTRQERHAFAGLRVVETTTQTAFPLPSAYDLAGYVRCLNTAGKLALLATVIRDDESTTGRGGSGLCRVAIVDLALEKIAPTTSRRPRKTMEQRIQNLAKK